MNGVVRQFASGDLRVGGGREAAHELGRHELSGRRAVTGMVVSFLGRPGSSGPRHEARWPIPSAKPRPSLPASRAPRSKAGLPSALTLARACAASRGPRHAQLDGFDLCANVRAPPNDRARLEPLCRYLLRPPLAQHRVQLRPDGRILVELKATQRDATSHLLLDPIESLEKLAAIIARPAVKLGALPWRPRLSCPLAPTGGQA